MSHESNDKRRRFEQKMRDQGTDGFADGPRPWETWDESGNQANNRIWEGSARRVNGKYKTHSLGHRILSVLALMALTTLLVGIGGVYYTHTQTQQVAATGIQPLPVINQPRPVIAVPDSEIVATVTETEDLNILTAPAAGREATQPESETAVTKNETLQLTAEPVPEITIDVTPAIVTETVPPASNDSIDSVAIETVVTEQSITTTVYTRHLQQDEPEIVSAIKTTPPPFAHEVAAVEQEVTDFPPAVQTDTLVLAEVDTVDDPDTAFPQKDQPEVVIDEQPTEQTDDVTTVALAEKLGETTAVVESPAETAPEVIEEQQSEIVEPVIPVAKTGNWVINLSSYTRKSTANRKLALFQQQGVDAEVFEVIIKDKPMYRIRVTGFENSRLAKAEIPALEQKLGLEGTWISKR